jgi:hypothetical protein
MLLAGCCAVKLRGRKDSAEVDEDMPRQVLRKPRIPLRLRPGVGWALAGLKRLGVRASKGSMATMLRLDRRFPTTKTEVGPVAARPQYGVGSPSAGLRAILRARR